MTLIKRSDKGQALTYEEMDGNFTHLGGDGSYQFPATAGLPDQVLVTGSDGNLIFVDYAVSSLKGSVYADDSTLLVDGVEGKIVGPVVGEVTPTMFKPPMLTQVEIDALTPSPGMMVYNTTTGKFQGYAQDANNDSTTAWADLH